MFKIWHVADVVRAFSFYNHVLDVNPVKICLRVTFLFVLLSLCVLQEEHADEEVKKEEGANQNEDHVEYGIDRGCLLYGTLINTSGVHSRNHNIWPSFKTGHNEQSHHSLEDVIVI